jgi:hypothetical protein
LNNYIEKNQDNNRYSCQQKIYQYHSTGFRAHIQRRLFMHGQSMFTSEQIVKPEYPEGVSGQSGGFLAIGANTRFFVELI